MSHINTTQWTLAHSLQKQAKMRPEKLAIQFIDDNSLTFQQWYQRGQQVATGLSSIDVTYDDCVACMLPNNIEFCEVWAGIALCDAVMAAINTELKGQFLSHALNICDAKVLVVHSSFLSVVQNVLEQLSSIEHIIVVDELGTQNAGLLRSKRSATDIKMHRFEEVFSSTKLSDLAQKQGQDLSALIYTSGTSGPSKAVMMPHAHCYLFAKGTIDNLDLHDDDRFYITMPMFHANGLLMQLYACLIVGATAIIRPKFSASNWLTDIQKWNITHTNLLGVMSEFVEQTPPSSLDKVHDLRVVSAAPASKQLITRFAERFNIQLTELYGMSEVNIPLFNPLNKPKPGSCGKPYSDYFELRIADPETDLELPANTVGEIQVRPKVAGGFMSGYYGMPEQTIEAWRNLWFHTGDAGIVDEEGYYFFIDRIKDCLRCKGENISSYEVESTLNQHEPVVESIVIGVPGNSADSEQEMLVVLVTQNNVNIDDGTFNFSAFIQFCIDNLPKYALPSYLYFMHKEDVPRTATNKIQKQKIKDMQLKTSAAALSSYFKKQLQNQ